MGGVVRGNRNSKKEWPRLPETHEPKGTANEEGRKEPQNAKDPAPAYMKDLPPSYAEAESSKPRPATQ